MIDRAPDDSNSAAICMASSWVVWTLSTTDHAPSIDASEMSRLWSLSLSMIRSFITWRSRVVTKRRAARPASLERTE